MRSEPLLVYGATGYTGRMAATEAVRRELDVVLGGRDEVRLSRLAAELGVPYRRFDAEDAELDGIGVLLNCAGPFAHTAAPLMRAAIRAGVSYLDISAELDGYRVAASLDAEARAAGVMLLPGSGGSVAMLGCLAARALETVREPRHIAIALHVAGGMSRGSATSASASVAREPLELAAGALVASPGRSRSFDFGDGPRSCFPVTLPDLLTLSRATGVQEIATFVHVSGNAFPSGSPDGPTAAERDANRYQAAVEVTDAAGVIHRATLETVNGYSFTPVAAAEAARRVLAGERRPGFQTPAEVFGNRFAETIADTRIERIFRHE